MDLYLVKKFKGIYRVKAHYDLETNDFIRDMDGNIDSDFADFYLSGRSGIEIKHGVGSKLACYIPKLQLGNNILRSYYSALIGDYKDKSMDIICKELIEHGYAEDIDILSSEVFFIFDVKYIDVIAPIVKLKTSGAKISPFSTRNLPKAPYTIPSKDLEEYQKAKGNLTGLEVGRLQEAFILSTFPATVRQDMRKEMLKGNQYIHKHGKWHDYCKYMEENNKK